MLINVGGDVGLSQSPTRRIRFHQRVRVEMWQRPINRFVAKLIVAPRLVRMPIAVPW